MRILCTLPNASDSINGVAFEPTDGGMLSEDVGADVAELFLSIPGYAPADGAPADDDAQIEALRAEAAALGVQVKGNWKAPRLQAEIDTAKLAKAAAGSETKE